MSVVCCFCYGMMCCVVRQVMVDMSVVIVISYDVVGSRGFIVEVY